MDIVTGAFGYIGKYIARALLEQGCEVRTITTHPNKPRPFGTAVKACSYSFDDRRQLTETLRGADVLYSTYWIRFPYDGQTYESALENTRTLFECARNAGVKRIVHVSVTHASNDSDLPYYRGKGIQESILKESGVSFSIVRPTLVFGYGDILVNNIAWLIRTCPVFPIFGSGNYRIQPVFVEDLARIAIQCSTGPSGLTVDAIGPETFTFNEMVRLIAETLERRIRFVRVPPAIGLLAGKIVGLFLGDVVLTSNELKGLMAELLTSKQPANAQTRFSEWLERNKSIVGTHYSSELARHFRWLPT
jgi:NADH dehydrogenase